jgi:hypothetical protein
LKLPGVHGLASELGLMWQARESQQLVEKLRSCAHSRNLSDLLYINAASAAAAAEQSGCAVTSFSHYADRSADIDEIRSGLLLEAQKRAIQVLEPHVRLLQAPHHSRVS